MDNKIVVFNALQTSLSGGIGRYSYELSKALYNLQQMSMKIVIREEDKLLFSFAKDEDLIVAKGIKNSKSRNYYEQFILPNKVHKEYPNAIIHYPDSMAPLFSKNKVVITVHDISFKAIDNVFTFKTKLWKSTITKMSLRKANKIIADTNFTKSEILKYYPNTKESNIEVVYCGFNDFSKESIDEVKINNKILNLKQKEYILTVSTISPRKNIDGLIKAFNIIKDKIDCNLVVAGKNGWLYENIYKLVDELHLKDRVIFTGEVNDDELKFLYKNAKLFVYPSFYEGFGLPPLEAMSFGIPVAVSNVTSIPEVVGIEECFFDPYKIREIGTSILDIIASKDLNERIIKQAYKRITKFSWSICSKNLVEVYKKL